MTSPQRLEALCKVEPILFKVMVAWLFVLDLTSQQLWSYGGLQLSWRRKTPGPHSSVISVTRIHLGRTSDLPQRFGIDALGKSVCFCHRSFKLFQRTRTRIVWEFIRILWQVCAKVTGIHIYCTCKEHVSKGFKDDLNSPSAHNKRKLIITFLLAPSIAH